MPSTPYAATSSKGVRTASREDVIAGTAKQLHTELELITDPGILTEQELHHRGLSE